MNNVVSNCGCDSNLELKPEKLAMREACRKRFAPVAERIRELLASSDQDPILVAIDGNCAGGKTTLGYYLQSLFPCNLYHMDDFFLQNYQRTSERLASPGGNVDYERFYEEVLDPVRKKQEVHYRPFRCDKREIIGETILPYQRLHIVEGSYSMHPYFHDPYAIKVFMKLDPVTQMERIVKRNGEEMAKQFQSRWIPMENHYFTAFAIEKDCMILSMGQ